MGFKFDKEQAKKCSPLGEMIADTFAKLEKLEPLLNIADDKKIAIDAETGAVSVVDKE